MAVRSLCPVASSGALLRCVAAASVAGLGTGRPEAILAELLRIEPVD